MKPVRCMIIDDERLARQHLRRLVKTRSDIEIVGEASSKSSALPMIEKLHPDLLLLDIQMPGGSGFDLLNAIANPPHVIFVTAYDRFAIRAFEVNALDYLLKPVTPERFHQAIDRALHLTRPDAAAAGSLSSTDIALLEIGGSGHFIAVDQILAVESEGNYTRVTTNDGKRLTARQPMKQWIERLPQEMFVQLDRGTVINRAGIKSADFSGRSAEVMMGEKGISLRLGATAAARLREILLR